MFTFAPTASRGHIALRGLLATILGILFVVWPDIAIGTAVILFAVYCLADAVVQVSNAFGGAETTVQRLVRFLWALLDVAAAAFAIAWPGPTAAVLAIIIGVWAIVGGLMELWAAYTLSSGWLTLTAVLSVAAGIVLVAWPGIGAVSLAIVVGAYLAAYGVVMLISAASSHSRADARVGGDTLRHA